MQKKLQAMLGFTMVELMIVIAIIGIIAVAVLSAIDPIEQINKGKDTRQRSDASEMLSALERYYATDEKYPWGSNYSANSGTTWDAPAIASELVKQSELKGAYQNRLGSGPTQTSLNVYVGSSETDLFVCFSPKSKQFLREASGKYSNTPGLTSITAITSTTYCMP